MNIGFKHKIQQNGKISFSFLLLIGFYIISFPSTSVGQTKNSKTYLYLEVDKLPSFGQNKADIFQYINSKLTWPKGFDGDGSVIVSFVVDKEGKVKNVTIIRRLCDDCDKEAKEIIQTMPTWKPGIKNGRPVNVRMYLPVKFMLK